MARAADVPVALVRRALMLRGDLGAVAEAALGVGAEALEAFRLEVGRPIAPMLASTAPDLDAALEKTGPAAVEWKLDGARIQVHRSGSDVGIFSRTLDDVTARLPEVVAAALALPGDAFVLDGEAIALRDDGTPYPFQVTGSRFASRSGHAVVLTPMFFDLLHLDGADLLDRPGSERAAALSALVPSEWRVPRGGPEMLEAALGAGARGRRRQGARRALRGGAARGRVGEGQARPHARSRRAGRRVGLGAPARVAVEPASRAPARPTAGS